MATTPTTVIDARPKPVDLYLQAGDDITLEIAVVDQAGAVFDLTGYTAEAQIRGTADAPLSADFVGTVLADKITLVMDSATTTTLPVKAVWDCQVISATGTVTTVAAGKVTVAAEVSR